MSDHLRVEYEHIRVVYGPYFATSTVATARESGFEIMPRGGKTICSILNAEGTILGMGIANCNKVDNFCKKVGRKVALDRALHSAGLKRSDLP